MNPLTGEQQVTMEGRRYTVRFTWAALAQILEKFGDAPNLFEVDVVAEVAALGMQAAHPEMTAAQIKACSPPLVPFVGAIQEALQWAYFGPEPPPEEGKKKTPTETGSPTPTPSVSGKASTPSNSGG